MKRLLRISGKILLWVITFLLFIEFVTMAQNNRFALEAPWVEKISNADSASISATIPISYSTTGFPFAFNSGTMRGSGWSVTTMNFAITAILFTFVGILLIKKPKIGFFACCAVILFCMANFFMKYTSLQ